MSLDLKTSGGTIVDGTGASRYRADIGIRNGQVVEIGAIATPAKRTLDAGGALVTPGFVDMHTHYDAQVLWDSELLPWRALRPGLPARRSLRGALVPGWSRPPAPSKTLLPNSPVPPATRW
jgi:hypothetical protein